MKFDVATNLDIELLKFIKEKDVNHEIVSLFGKRNRDIIGGGRPANPLVHDNEEIEYVKKYNIECNKMGLEFNYLLNPLCLGSKDVNSSQHLEIVNFIKKLQEIGITAVTVNSPYLCEIIKEQFPNIKVTVGLYAFVDSLMKVKRWVDLGADEITLVESINRNFPLLRQILTYLKTKNVDVRLIANNGCLHQCPFQVNHAASVSHDSTYDKPVGYHVDYSIINCYYRKVKDITNLISSDWIRPEDIYVYEGLCKEVGNDKLIIKLLERTKSTDYLKRVVTAYLDRHYKGNLSEILNWPEEGIGKIGTPKEVLQEKKVERNDIPSMLKKYFKYFKVPVPCIDNDKLDGFIDHFVNNYDCNNKICMSDGEKGEIDCNSCGYCYSWAKKVVSIPDEESREKWLKDGENLIKALSTSEIFIAK